MTAQPYRSMRRVLAVAVLLAPLALLAPVAALADPGIAAVTVHSSPGGGETYSLTVQVLLLMTAVTLLPAHPAHDDGVHTHHDRAQRSCGRLSARDRRPRTRCCSGSRCSSPSS